jgi:TELO2-interacting protein 2
LPRLSTKTWQLNPSMPFVFSCCLYSVCMPLLSDYLPMFLPPTVIFVDDHQPEICLLGIRCMQHIINNCSRAELRWFGRADVMYDSLWRAFIGCNKVNLDPLIACLLSALNVIEESPKARTGGKLLYDSRHDKLMNRYSSRTVYCLITAFD